jgi:carbonic anhydrase
MAVMMGQIVLVVTFFAPLVNAVIEYGSEEHEAMHDQWQYAPTEPGSCDAGATQKCGPSQWHTITGNEACAEQGSQSPTDLPFGFPEPPPASMGLPTPLKLHSGTCDSGLFMLNEHTTEVGFEETCKDASYLDFITSPTDSTAKRFDLSQFHYHSPSENTVDGKYFPMEVHHVHHAEDGQALVISVMIAVGTPTGKDVERSQFLLDMQNLMPPVLPEYTAFWNTTGNKYSWFEKFSGFDAYAKFIDVSEGYFYYEGSFTTPPCTSHTHWVVVRKPVVVPQSTLDLYRSLIGANPHNQLAPFGTILPALGTPTFNAAAGDVMWNSTLGCNNRPTQPFTGYDNPTRKLYDVRYASQTCGEIKASYKSSACCGSPGNPFTTVFR